MRHNDQYIVTVDGVSYGPFATESIAQRFAGRCDAKGTLRVDTLHDDGEYGLSENDIMVPFLRETPREMMAAWYESEV